MNNNIRLLDAILATAISISNFTGDYQNSTVYSVGDKAVDTVTGAIYTALVGHTSSATSTFAEARAANPTFWQAYALDAESRGAWTTATLYAINDFVVSGYKYAVCVEAHTSGATFESDGSKWEVLVDLTSAVTDAMQAADDAETSAIAAAASAGTNIGWLQSSRVISGDETLDKDTDNGVLIAVDASGGDVVLTLPAASGAAGFRLAIVRVDSSGNSVSIARAGSDTINGATAYTLAAQYDAVVIARRTSALYTVVSIVNQFLSNDAGTARTALGLGTMAVEAAADYLAVSGNLSDVGDAATAFDNIKQAASELVSGVVTFATEAEAATGTETGKAVTPAGVAAAVVAGAATFPSGTKMLFVQTAAPTGWTKDTNLDNHALRLVSGTVGTGGTADFTSAFASRTPTGSISINSPTIAVGNLPATAPTTNTVLSGSGLGGVTGLLWTNQGGQNGDGGATDGGVRSINALGSGTPLAITGSFTGVAMSFAVKYQDVIKATKD